MPSRRRGTGRALPGLEWLGLCMALFPALAWCVSTAPAAPLVPPAIFSSLAAIFSPPAAVYTPPTAPHATFAPPAIFSPPATVYTPPATIYSPPTTIYSPPSTPHATFSLATIFSPSAAPPAAPAPPAVPLSPPATVYFPPAALLETGKSSKGAQAKVEVFLFAEDLPRLVREAGIPAQIYVLDAKLPPITLPSRTPSKSEHLRRWLRSPAGRRTLKRMKHHYTGWEKALNYQLEGTPAVVFDSGAAVIYGATHVPQARTLYHRHRKGPRP